MLKKTLNNDEQLIPKQAEPVADVLTPDVKAESIEAKDAGAPEVAVPDSTIDDSVPFKWNTTEAPSGNGFSPEAFLAETDANSIRNRPTFDPDDFLGTKVEAPAPSPLMKDGFMGKLDDKTIPRLFENAPPYDPGEDIPTDNNLRGSVFEKHKLLNDTKAGMGKFINDVAARLDPSSTPAEVMTNPVGVIGFGAIKAVDRLAAGIADFPSAVADGMNRSIDLLTGEKGTDIYKTPEFLDTFSEAMNWYADTLDEKAVESVAESFKDGDTAEAFVKKLTTITGDTVGAVMFYRGLGINPFSAQAKSGNIFATMKVRAAHAAAYGLIKGGLGTTGTIKERSQAAIITTAYMGTMAISPWFGKVAEKFGAGPVISALATKLSDFAANTGISIKSGGYKDAQARAAQIKEEYGLTPERFEIFGVKTDAIELMQYAGVALPDGYFSALTTGFGRPQGTAEQGRSVTVTKDAARESNYQDNSRAQKYVSDARVDLEAAQTPVEKAIANSRIDQGLSTIQDLQASRAAIDEAPGDRVIFDNPNNKASRMSARVSQDLVRKDEEMFMKAPTYFSPLTRAVDGLKQTKGTPEQMKAMLSKTTGVKIQEMEETGFSDWMDMKAENGVRVTKDEMQAFMEQNGVRVEEVVASDVPEGKERYDELSMARVTRELTGDERQEINEYESSVPDVTSTKFKDFQIPGGKNYKEMLLTVPDIGKPPIRKLEGGFQAGFPDRGQVTWGKTEEAALDKYRKTWGQSQQNQFTSSHFDEPNIVAHIRNNERTTADGKRMLFIEEVQSDWHQAGRKKGYDSVEYLVHKIGRSPENFGTRYQAEVYAAEVDKMDGGGSRGPFDSPARIEEVKSGVPDAPFKGAAWKKLAMRRMIKYAADNGFDSIGWTTGEQQAERYDLSKQVKEIYWNEDADFLEFVDINGREHTESPVTRDTLADFVGKEAAEKLVSPNTIQKDVKDQRVHVIKDADLKVGGEGMKGFYDRELPNLTKDIARKMDKTARVGTTTLTYQDGLRHTTTIESTIHSMEITDSMRSSARDGVPMYYEGDAPAGPSRPLNQELWRVPELPKGQQAPAGKVSEIVERISSDDPSTALLGNVFRKAEKHLGAVDIDVIYANDPKLKYFGVYKVKDGKQSITLNFGTIGKDAELAAFALGHERLHPVTKAILDNPLTDRQKSAKNKIEILRHRAEMDQQKYTAFADKNFKPHFKDLHEFMAGFKTDMTFRKYLRVVEQDSASVFRRLVDTVKGDVFGIKPATEADLAFDRLIEFPELQQEIFQTRAREERRKKGMVAEQVNEEAIAKERDHLPAPRHPVGSASAADWADKQAAERAARVEQTGDKKGRWSQRQWEDAASRLRDYNGDVSALNTVQIAEMLGVKNPAANPGDRARKIYAEIDMMRRYGAAQVINDASSLDQARGMPPQPEAKIEFTGDLSASEYVQRGWKLQDLTRNDTRHKKFSSMAMTKSTMGGPHEGIKDAHDMFGAIETATGERGVYATGREILKGRQYYSKLRESVGDFLAGDGYILRDSETGMLDTKQVFNTVEDARVASDGKQEIVRKQPATREIAEMLPEALRGEMHAYMSNRPQDAPNLNKYWRDIADVWKYLNNADPTNLARVKFRRILHYAKDGRQWQSITKEQQQFLLPVRSWYQKNVNAGSATTGDFYDYVRQLIETSESDVLVRGNYVPHVSKSNSHRSAVKDIEAQRTAAKAAGTLTPEMDKVFDSRIETVKYNEEQDPDNPVFGKAHIRDIDLGAPADLKKRSTVSLKTRDPDAKYNPFESNPLTESYDNYFRHMAAYYMEPHVEDMRAKLITGRYSDGTPANSRSSMKHGEGLVTDKTADVITKWMQSLIGLHVKRNPWEQVLAKARGNAAKLMFSRFNLIPKQMGQEMTTTEGSPYRYRLKPHEKARDYLTRDLDRVKVDFRKKVVEVYGEDMADDFMSRMANEILVGKHQMKREVFGDIPAVDMSDMAIGFKLFWKPFSWLTANPAIDVMNKAPFGGGDFAARKQTEFDSKNRYIHMMGWLNAGKDLILDPIARGEQPPPFEKLLGTMRELGQSPVKMETFSEANKLRLAELYARGQYEEFVWAVGQDHTTQGHFIYDTKIRSVYEAYPAIRAVTQYQTWTRNYTIRRAKALSVAIKGDRLSEHPKAKRLAGIRTLAEGVGGAAVFNIMFQAATGRLPAPSDGDFDELSDIPDMLWQSIKQTLSPADWVDPYSSNPLAIPATPIHMVQGLVQLPYPWVEQKWNDRSGPTMPSQITSSVMNFAKVYYNAFAGIAIADAYRRFGDEEAGNKMLKARIESLVTNADEFIESYYWPYMRAGFIFDSVEFDMEDGASLRKRNYRNYNLVKGMVTAAVTKKLGYTPEWIEPYDDPSHVERNLYRTATHLIFGGGTPPYEKVEEVEGFSMPKPEKSDRERDIDRERLDRSVGVGSRKRRVVP